MKKGIDTEELIRSASVLKKRYEEILSLFSWKENKKRNEAMRKMKEEVFGLEKVAYWKRERTWDYLNKEIDYEQYVILMRNSGQPKAKRG